MEEKNKLRKKAENLEYWASTLIFQHQLSLKIELKAKARELRELLKEKTE